MTVPTGNRLNNGVSKSFVRGRSCATGIGGQIIYISCRTRMSLSVSFGAACKDGVAGLSNSLLIISAPITPSDRESPVSVYLLILGQPYVQDPYPCPFMADSPARSVFPIFDNCQPSQSSGYLVLNCPNVCGVNDPLVHL